MKTKHGSQRVRHLVDQCMSYTRSVIHRISKAGAKLTRGRFDTDGDGIDESIGTSVGYLSADRLADIPANYHARHEFLVYVFVLLQDLVVETQEQAPRRFAVKYEEIPESDRETFAADPIGYAAKSLPKAKKPILLDVSIALMADFYIFLHHALTAFERRQFIAGYANLRKPFRENLLLLSWICADEDEFFDKFLTDPVKAFNSGALSPGKRHQIFEKAKVKGDLFADFPNQVVEDLIFSRAYEHGLGPMFDKACHLVTSKRDMRTEEMNLNFIFKDPRDNDVYEVGYLSLSLLVLYAYLVIFTVCNSFHEKPRHYVSWKLLAVWGAYEAIFQNRKSDLLASFEQTCSETLCCMHCAHPFELTPKNIPRFIMIERIQCSACGRDQAFPLFWLFCRERAETEDELESDDSSSSLE